MFNILSTEFLKLKRSKMLWLILIGSVLPVLISELVLSNSSSFNFKPNYWGVHLHTVLCMANNIYPVFLAVITGFIFSREYSEKTINTLFTYPISRLKFYACKIILTMQLSAIMLVFTLILAVVVCYISKLNYVSSYIIMIYLKTSLWTLLANFSLIPLAALVGIITKSSLPPAILGTLHFVSFLFINRLDVSIYLPGVIPYLIASKASFAMRGYISFDVDLHRAYLTLLITFVASVIIGALYYKNADVS